MVSLNYDRGLSAFVVGDTPFRLTPDQRRMASVFSANDRFANSFGEGAPLRSTPFSNDEFRVAAQSRFGIPLTCLKPLINQPLKSSASAPDKFVDAFGNNIKKLVGAEGGGTTANHNSFLNVISAWSRRARIPHRGGTSGTPRTCKGMFSAYTQALHDLDLSVSFSFYTGGQPGAEQNYPRNLLQPSGGVRSF